MFPYLIVPFVGRAKRIILSLRIILDKHDYPDHVSILLGSKCQHVWKKKKNQSDPLPFRSAQS